MKTLSENLKAATSDVMEKMFFILPDIDGKPLPIEAGTDISTIHIGIKGSPAYILTFHFEKRLAVSMARDFFGGDDSGGDDQVLRKCLKETANIFAGRFLLTLEDQENRNITLPTTERDGVFGPCDTIERDTALMSFGEGRIEAVIETVAASTWK